MTRLKKIGFDRLFPLVLVALALALPCNGIGAEKLDHSGLRSVPVQHEGRVKPLDTFARVHLLLFYGKSRLPDASPLEWLIEALFLPDQANQRKIFNISNPEVTAALSLPYNPQHKYSYNEISPGLQKNFDTIRRLADLDRKQKTLAQQQLEQLYYKMMRYSEITRSFSLIIPQFTIKSKALATKLNLPSGKTYNYLEMQPARRELSRLAEPLMKKDAAKQSESDKEIIQLNSRMNWVGQDSGSQYFRIIPPQWGNKSKLWLSPWGVVMSGQGSPKSARYTRVWENLAQAYLSRNATEWDKAVTEIETLSKSLAEHSARTGVLSLEVLYNRLDLFTNSMVLYILAFLALAFSWIFWPERLQMAALWILLLGLVLHTVGLIMRFIVMLRPPVATLYESIVFVAWVAVLIAVIMEFRRKNGFGLLVGSVAGIVLHIIGISYAYDGDSMGMLAAVLNTNFWLAVHVLTISIGYGACFVGGVMGHIYLVFRIMRPQDETRLDQLYRNMHGVTLVALFFAILGTVTGGIWADQSWGRFWGWDPKENGALLICLWLLWLLHGKLATYIRAPGFAVALIINNVIVALAWFGVNLLDIGLHSYGFAGNVAINLALFSAFEILFALFGYLLATQRIRIPKLSSGG